jgi:prephenate dehydrogenase
MQKGSVGIIGVGLIGGSIGLQALRSGRQVFLFEPFARNKVTNARFPGAQIVSTLADLVVASHLIFVATPVSAIPGVARELVNHVAPGHVVSDVASVKRPVAEILAEALLGRCQYVPTHPMAGSEQSGADAARADLFDDAVAFICPEFASEPGAVDLVTLFWEDLGARAVRSTVTEHDQLVAAMSHLPHVVAALLVNQVARSGGSRLAGPGYRDTTRIASGSPALWSEILVANSDLVLEQLTGFKDLLEEFLSLLSAKDVKKLQAFLDEAKRNRDI